MSKIRFSTIKALVFDTIHCTEGRISYKKLETLVLKRFPDSAFKKTHWMWYRYQCTKGKYANHFSKLEKNNLSSTLRCASANKSKKRIEENRLKVTKLKTVPITEEILSRMKKVIKASLAYENAVGGTRKTGITAEVGEILACYHLRLRLCADPKAKGFDAIDRRGRQVQIKTRRSETEGLPSDLGRLSSFSKHPFDYVVLVLLNPDYSLAEMWQAEYREVILLIEKHKRRNPNLSYFKKVAKRICLD